MKSSVYDKDEVEARKRNQQEQPYVSSDEELEEELRRRGTIWIIFAHAMPRSALYIISHY